MQNTEDCCLDERPSVAKGTFLLSFEAVVGHAAETIPVTITFSGSTGFQSCLFSFMLGQSPGIWHFRMFFPLQLSCDFFQAASVMNLIQASLRFLPCPVVSARPGLAGSGGGKESLAAAAGSGRGPPGEGVSAGGPELWRRLLAVRAGGQPGGSRHGSQ